MEQEILQKLEHLRDEIEQIEEDIRLARQNRWETHELYKARNRCHEHRDELKARLGRSSQGGSKDLSDPQIILSTSSTRRKDPEALKHTPNKNQLSFSK